MRNDTNAAHEEHTKLILERYKDRENVSVHQISHEAMVERYLSKVMVVRELQGKVLLELGAGCSTYVPLFLESGLARYYANDIIPERLEATRVDDPRFVALPGDFRTIEIPEPVDIIFASLTMMLVMPMLDDFIVKIRSALKPGGIFMSMDANYFCPLSVYRRYADRGANPVRMFNPFRYADKFRMAGFEIEKLVPFTAPAPGVGDNWLLGTTFWMRARKF